MKKHMKALDANIGDKVTYAKWYVDDQCRLGRIGHIIDFDETPRECTYIVVKWEDSDENDFIQEDGLKLVTKKKSK